MRAIQIKDYPAYRIREDGVLETNWRQGPFYPNMPCADKWRPLPARIDSNGYAQACLCDSNKKKRRTHIHRLVAECFIGPPPFNGACVRHLDSNPLNNSISNLAWGTYKDNEDDKIQNGTWNTRNGGARLIPQQVIEIRRRVNTGESQKTLAVEYGVSRPTITRIANNTIWR